MGEIGELGRPASSEDLAYWVGRKVASPRDEITKIFLGSDEYAQAKRLRRAASANPGLRR